MIDLLAIFSLSFTILLALLAVVVAVVSGLLYRARRAARIVEAADLTEPPKPRESGDETSLSERAAA